MRRRLVVVASFVLACTEPIGTQPTTVQLDVHDLVLGRGVTLRLQATATSASPIPRPAIRWRSTNQSKVAVDTIGRITALDTGSAYIVVYVTFGGGRDSALVTVRPLSFTSVWTGDSHACGISPAQDLYCWGSGDFGELGNGSRSIVNGPVRVASSLRFVEVTGGNRYTCARTSDDEVYCWGLNTFGELGIGSVNIGFALLPQHVDTTLSALGGGANHVCGVGATGIAYCWGANFVGQLGIGTPPTSGKITSPTPVAGNLSFQTVGGGYAFSCGLMTDSTVTCWGSPVGGALGIGQLQCGDEPVNCLTPVGIHGDHHFTQLSVGVHSSCGRTESSTLYCWGSEFGDTAMAVAPGWQFSTISVGMGHRCGLVDNDMYCWGSNASGQLGIGTTTASDTPVLVAGGHQFARVSAGSAYTCGVTTSNVAYCWGIASNRLGVGPGVSNLVPGKVLGQP